MTEPPQLSEYGQRVVTGAVEGADILDEVAALIDRYTAFPTEHALPAVTLWAAHTHAASAFYTSPRLILDSAEPGSGKTRVLEVLQHLVHNAEMTLSASTAAIFRMLQDEPATLLFDEVDAIFNPKNGGNNEDLRALLNAGYKRTATIPRCVGDASNMRVERYPVFAPVALAGIAGHMPDTLTTRSVTIHMRRRAPGEHVAPFRERKVERAAESLRERLNTWVETQAEQLADAEPELPEGVEDRPAEVWEPLIAVADAAGGRWPELARKACAYFVLNTDPSEVSLGVRLLMDIRAVFDGADRMRTEDLLDKLRDLDEAPWATLGGAGIDARYLSRELSRYGVKPDTVNFGGTRKKGYATFGTKHSVGLADAWSRYLPAAPRNERNEGNHAGQNSYGTSDESVTSRNPHGSVTELPVTGESAVTAVTSNVTEVTEVTGQSGSPCSHCGEPIGRLGYHPNCDSEAEAS